MKKNIFKRGFTLIELLVVIAIIGILASVVLASLNSARDKGADAAVKSSINNMRAQAELFYDDKDPNSYTGLCVASATNDPAGIADGISQAEETAGSVDDVDCRDSALGYTITALLTNGEVYCVDSTGVSMQLPEGTGAGQMKQVGDGTNWAEASFACNNL